MNDRKKAYEYQRGNARPKECHEHGEQNLRPTWKWSRPSENSQASCMKRLKQDASVRDCFVPQLGCSRGQGLHTNGGQMILSTRNVPCSEIRPLQNACLCKMRAPCPCSICTNCNLMEIEHNESKCIHFNIRIKFPFQCSTETCSNYRCRKEELQEPWWTSCIRGDGKNGGLQIWASLGNPACTCGDSKTKRCL